MAEILKFKANRKDEKMEFKIGDEVTLKTWDELVSEFRVDVDGLVRIESNYMSDEIKFTCGNSFEITKIDDNGIRLNIPDKDYWCFNSKSFVSTDNINPSHYKSQCSLECIEAMQMAFGKEIVYDFCICNAWKYMWRYENKNGVEDLKKTEWYLNKAKELIDYRSEHENIQQVLDGIKRRVK